MIQSTEGLVPSIQCGFPLTASIKYEGTHEAYRAAFNYIPQNDSSTWVASVNDNEPWLQVNFLGVKHVKAIETKGRPEGDQFVT